MLALEGKNGLGRLCRVRGCASNTACQGGRMGMGTTDEPECGHMLCTCGRPYLLTASPLHARQMPASVASCLASSSGDLAPNPTIDNMSRREASGALIVGTTILWADLRLRPSDEQRTNSKVKRPGMCCLNKERREYRSCSVAKREIGRSPCH